MSDSINSDLIRGNIDTIILRALYEGDRYGYDILKEIEQRSKGKYQLKQPTLYSSLKRLETQGFIKSYWGAKSIGGRRKYFTLTDMGKEVFMNNKADWEYSRTLIDALIAMGEDSTTNNDNDSVVEPLSSSEYNEDYDETFDESDFTESESDQDLSSISSEEFETQQEESLSESVSDDDDVLSQTETQNDENKDNYCDAVVFIDDKQYYDDDIQEENNDTVSEEEPDKKVDLIYSSDYREKQSYIGTMRDKTYQPENVDAGFADNYEQDLGNYNDDRLSVDDDDFFDNSEEVYHEHGEIKNPINFGGGNTFSKQEQQEPPPAPPNPRSEFYNYHSDLGRIENVALPETDGTSLLNRLDEKAKTMPSYTPPTEQQQKTPTPPQFDTQPEPADNDDDDINNMNFNLSHKIQMRKFDTVIQTASEYGNDVVIKRHDENVGREYNKKFYFYNNKLALFKYGILFGVMLAEVLLTFLLIQFVLKPYPTMSSLDKTVFILSVVFSALFPIISAFVYRFYYDARKRSDFNLGTSLAYRFIFMAQAILVIYALNLYFGMPISTSPEYYISFIIPSVLSTNIPVAAIIFNKLLKSGKFNVGA